MMDILYQIAKSKRTEVQERRTSSPLMTLGKTRFFNRIPPSFYDALAADGPSIIAEFKRRSPSRGTINSDADITSVAINYQKAGIQAMSILTDGPFFGGSNTDLETAASITDLPLLRKDFIVDAYQVFEAKSIGASAIILIASLLTKYEVAHFATIACELGMDILFEIHEAADLDKICDEIKIIGVNNRNLKSFGVNMQNSANLLKYLPGNCLRVAESGISNPEDVITLYEQGFDAFLIGEYFMKHEDPGSAAGELTRTVKSLVR